MDSIISALRPTCAVRRRSAISIQAEFRAEQDERDKRSIRRDDAPPLDPALLPIDDQLRLRLAEELDYARDMLDAMGDELVRRHGRRHAHVALQAVDIVGQMLGHIAAMSRSVG